MLIVVGLSCASFGTFKWSTPLVYSAFVCFVSASFPRWIDFGRIKRVLRTCDFFESFGFDNKVETPIFSSWYCLVTVISSLFTPGMLTKRSKKDLESFTSTFISLARRVSCRNFWNGIMLFLWIWAGKPENEENILSDGVDFLSFDGVDLGRIAQKLVAEICSSKTKYFL